MSTERYVNNGQTTVATGVAAGDGVLVVADATRLPTLTGSDQYRIVVYTPSAPANAEIMLVTAVSGNTLTITRAAEAIGGVQAAFGHPTADVVAGVLSVGSLTNIVQGIGDLRYQAAGVVADRNFVFDQASPSATWVIAHGLGKYPAVSVVDSARTQVQGHVGYDSLNQCTVTFSAPFSGSAYLN